MIDVDEYTKMLEDVAEDVGLITLTADTGEDVDFVKIADIVYKDEYYLIMQPAELFEGMNEDEALVFKVVENNDGTDSYIMIDDDEIIDGVFEIYDRLYEESKSLEKEDNEDEEDL